MNAMDEEICMKALKWIVLGFSVLTIILGLAAKLQSFGGQGVFTLAASALPGVLVALSLAFHRPFGRLLAGISLVAFLIVGLKTSQGSEFENIMMAAFVGILVTLVVLVKPEKASAVRIAGQV
jgi:apolipoprotein N-acyltransferase